MRGLFGPKPEAPEAPTPSAALQQHREERARSLRTINFVRRQELLKELKAAGGDIVLVDEPGAVEEALRLVGDGSVRLGVDAIGGSATATLVQALSPGGVLVAYAAASGEPMSVNALQLIFKQLQVQGFFLGYFDYEKKVLPAMRAAAPLAHVCATRARDRH